VLVRLPAITKAQLRKLIVDAWRCQAAASAGRHAHAAAQALAAALIGPPSTSASRSGQGACLSPNL
jgi:hypothetical protein